MSIRDQVARTLDRGSLLRDEAYGEELEFSDSQGVLYQVRGVMSGARESGTSGEGGLMLECDGQIRVRKVAAVEAGLVLEIGQLVRRLVDAGGVYRVDGIRHHDGSPEWLLDINEA